MAHQQNIAISRALPDYHFDTTDQEMVNLLTHAEPFDETSYKRDLVNLLTGADHDQQNVDYIDSIIVEELPRSLYADDAINRGNLLNILTSDDPLADDAFDTFDDIIIEQLPHRISTNHAALPNRLIKMLNSDGTLNDDMFDTIDEMIVNEFPYSASAGGRVDYAELMNVVNYNEPIDENYDDIDDLIPEEFPRSLSANHPIGQQQNVPMTPISQVDTDDEEEGNSFINPYYPFQVDTNDEDEINSFVNPYHPFIFGLDGMAEYADQEDMGDISDFSGGDEDDDEDDSYKNPHHPFIFGSDGMSDYEDGDDSSVTMCEEDDHEEDDDEEPAPPAATPYFTTSYFVVRPELLTPESAMMTDSPATVTEQEDNQEPAPSSPSHYFAPSRFCQSSEPLAPQSTTLPHVAPRFDVSWQRHPNRDWSTGEVIEPTMCLYNCNQQRELGPYRCSDHCPSKNPCRYM